jgi:hypothetical protein
MFSWPKLGTRVTVRYRRPAGATPPLTDAVGRLLQVDPLVRVQTKTGSIVACAPGDVVAMRALTDAPVRTSQIRALEHAAALAWPGLEQHWLDGWLLRAGRGTTLSSDSAVPLDVSARAAAIPEIVDWYRRRGLTPRLSVPNRLLRPAGAAEQPNRVLVRDVAPAAPDPSVMLAARPYDAAPYRVPVDVLTAVVEGELMFAHAGTAVARASVTDAPDGTRWAGLSALRINSDQPAAQKLCEALLGWGASRGATRGYVRVLDDDRAKADLVESLGFTLHHHSRYLLPT